MLKFTGNYSNTEHNFVIQNLPTKRQVAENDLQLISVLKNILLRGAPTILSKYLQKEFGIPFYYKNEYFKIKVPLIAQDKQNWYSTIGGDNRNQYFPAKEFYNSISILFPKFQFIQNLIQPETSIAEIIEEGANDFIEQRVDFYLEIAKLVIEIDGEQHIRNVALDRRRDELFKSNNIITVRIATYDLKNKTSSYLHAIQTIGIRLNQFAESINIYSKKQYTAKEIKNKLIPTSALRWQILLLSLLENGTLSFSDKNWKINIVNSDISDFALLSTKDFFIWTSNLFKLYNKHFTEPSINISENKSYQKDYINIDFSLLKRWTDENELSPNIIFVRTDYLQSKNYFEVSSNNPIKYNLSEEIHQLTLEFFLQNIFDKLNFREGQLSIICNALNRNDTIGLLPTGAGKSICYQLSAMLQPGVSFIISPLKSLMFDQKENLDSAFVSNTNYISSDQTAEKRANIQKLFGEGKYLFVWISPERLQIKTFREYLSKVNTKYKIIYAVIDEVHCLSEWGHDFRISYLNLARTIKKYCPNANYLGLTATASNRVQHDIKAEFNIDDKNIKSLISFDRKELTFIVKKCASNEKLQYAEQIIEDFQKETNFINIEGENGKACIIFTPHVNWNFGCYGIYKAFDRIYPKKVDFYSGEVPKIKTNGLKQSIMPEKEYEEYKIEVQRKFRKNQFSILTSTKAFGMGIDKPNINLTIHFGISPSIESIYQEAGRAGRDPDKEVKAKSKCYILFSDEENNFPEELVFNKDTTAEQLHSIVQEIGINGNDLVRALYFHNIAYTGIDAEYNAIKEILHSYIENGIVKIYWDYSNKVRKEKAIYRLYILKVISDYTVEFNGKYFEVTYNKVNNNLLLSGIKEYISKYDDIKNIENEIAINRGSKFSEKCIRYLIQWVYNNIAYERKQALKGIAELCRNYKDSDDFKRKIIAYFDVNEITFLLQHISEHPNDFQKWFDVFIKRNQKFEIIGYILKDDKELENLKLKLQRFLESYKNNTGLNFISGIVRLFLNEFDDQDGRIRFEQALNSIQENFDEVNQKDIIDKTLELGLSLDIIARSILSSSILKIFPQYFQKFYDVLNDTYSLDFILQKHTTRLQNINSILYGKLA